MNGVNAMGDLRGGPRAGAGKPVGAATMRNRLVARLAADLIEDEEYLRRLRVRLQEGTAPPAVETMLWYYAYGKPSETLDLNLPSAVNQPLNPAALRERAAALAEMIQRLTGDTSRDLRLASPEGVVGAPGSDSRTARLLGTAPPEVAATVWINPVTGAPTDTPRGGELAIADEVREARRKYEEEQAAKAASQTANDEVPDAEYDDE